MKKRPAARRKTVKKPAAGGPLVKKRSAARRSRAGGGAARALRAALKGRAPAPGVRRWNADPEDVQRSVVKLVLTLVEFLRKLLEKQAIRRMDAGTLTTAETEAVGRALMQLEQTVGDLARRFGLSPADLNLELGPLGRLI